MVEGWHGVMGGSRFKLQWGLKKDEKKEKIFTYQKKKRFSLLI